MIEAIDRIAAENERLNEIVKKAIPQNTHRCHRVVEIEKTVRVIVPCPYWERFDGKEQCNYLNEALTRGSQIKICGFQKKRRGEL